MDQDERDGLMAKAMAAGGPGVSRSTAKRLMVQQRPSQSAAAMAALAEGRVERGLSVIAREIRRDWARPYFGAVPYLDAMAGLDSMGDSYGMDSASSIVRYFLANAQTWRGEVAKRVKAELKAMLEGRD